jgi:outer membrane protein TolC
MRGSFITLLILIFASVIRAQSSQPMSMSLEDCINHGLGNNEQLKITELEKEKSDAQVREIVSMGLPQANINAGMNYNYEVQTSLIDASNFDPSLPEGTESEIKFGQPYDGNWTFDIDQLIFDGAYFVGIEAARTFRELAKKENVRARIDIIEGVSKAYYTVLVNEQEIELLEKNFNRLDTLLRETQSMYENGFAEKLMLIESE